MRYMSFEESLTLLAREAVHRRGAIVSAFCLLALLFLGVGLLWKNSYESSVTLYFDDANIIRPIMEGAAVTTDVTDRAAIAREVIFSDELLKKVLKDQGWLTPYMSAQEVERTQLRVMKKTEITNLPGNLINISYKDTDPRRAYATVKQFGDLFIASSIRDQARESNEAFDFIDSQVEEYRTKLASSEARLKEFKARMVDARPGNESNVEDRILELRRKVERTELELAEARIRVSSLERELSSEAASSVSVFRETQYQEQVAELQSELDRLRLDYTETYPDIVRLKQQIRDIQNMATRERQRRNSGQFNGATSSGSINSTTISPLYQQLKADSAKAKTSVQTLSVRLSQTRILLERELSRASRTSDIETQLADLNRDYEVNRDIYQDFLKRRESARVSMNLDRERRGLSFRVQEPARLPNLPTGIRFIHFAILGILLGLVIPFSVLYAYLRLDPRIRLASSLQEDIGVPVVAVVPRLVGPNDSGSFLRSRGFLFFCILLVAAVYMAAGWIKLTKAI